MRIKPWIRDHGTEFYELIDVSGFAVGNVFNKEAAELFAAAPELLEALNAVSASVLRAGSNYPSHIQKLVADALNKAERRDK